MARYGALLGFVCLLTACQSAAPKEVSSSKGARAVGRTKPAPGESFEDFRKRAAASARRLQAEKGLPEEAPVEPDGDVGTQPLINGLTSELKLGEAFAAALNVGSYDELMKLMVAANRPEYQRLLPALLTRSDGFKIDSSILWASLVEDTKDACRHLAEKYRGQNYEFVRFEGGDVKDKTHLRIVRRPVVVLRGKDGSEQRLEGVLAIIEHKPSGTFKFSGLD